MLEITYLAAGFLIGEKGQSIRDMERITSTTIKSWKDRTASGRPVRKLVVESHEDSSGDVKSCNVARCLHIIKAAVMHYKDLCEGLYCGEYVEPVRVIEGVAFTYAPPPRKNVPYAAGIKVKASKVMDAYGGEVNVVPSKYKKEVDVGEGEWRRGRNILERGGGIGAGGVDRVDRVDRVDCVDHVGDSGEEKDGGAEGKESSMSRRLRRKKGKRGARKEKGGPSGDGVDDDGSINNYPEFGLFEVPCEEDFQPRERNMSRKQRPRYVIVAVDSFVRCRPRSPLTTHRSPLAAPTGSMPTYAAVISWGPRRIRGATPRGDRTRCTPSASGHRGNPKPTTRRSAKTNSSSMSSSTTTTTTIRALTSTPLPSV